MDKYSIRELIAKLNEYTRLYDEGKPAISDTKWDKMYFELKQLEQDTGIIYPDSPTQSISYEVVSNLRKVEHSHPMLSLDKTKDWNEFVQYFGDKDVVGMCKLDGLTCCLTYEHGHLIGAETRGDGKTGEWVLHNAKVIKSIPQTIKYDGRLIIDGEIICTEDNFEPFSNEYKNPRNFASGSIRLLDANECAKRNLTFVAWNVVEGLPWNTVIDNFTEIDKLGFTVVPWTSSLDLDAKEFLIKQAKELGYPIDGLVARFNDIAYGNALGETEHHARAAYAFKFEDELYETTLKDIEWSMGRSGQITPVAIFNEIDANGSAISRASLHNISIMKEIFNGMPKYNQTIRVFKANEIIPQIASADPDGEEEFIIPTICPICGGNVALTTSDSSTVNLTCLNPQCPAKLINQLDYFVGKKCLDVKGLSIATLEKLIDLGWLDNIVDIFNLKDHRDEWINLPGFGVKSVDNILNNIENAKNCDLATFICALGIPLIGSAQSKILSAYCGTWDTFRELVNKKYDFSKLDGFGEAKTSALLKYDYMLADDIAPMFININTAPEEKSMEETVAKKQLCNGLSFVITGRLLLIQNREKLINIIEERGGKVQSSISSKTTYLVCNDLNSTSTKFKKAKELKIPIISEEELLKMCDYKI